MQRPTQASSATPRHLSITFDDGPDETMTPRILSILRDYGVPATFFCIGQQVERFPQVLKAIHEAGHEIGNHTMTHPYLTKLTDAEIEKELKEAVEAIQKVVPGPVRYFRPPYGDIDARVRRIAASMHEEVVLWDIDSVDWSGIPGPTIAANVLPKLTPGGIILMHAGPFAKGTPEALPYVLEVAVAMGYDFVPLAKLQRT
ncbi:polysaccharide deacetylase family protein [Alicyclobacillus vulcanalis]|uniref:Peptidoglycan/xylan/chitin deacetylase, PgdA/CDA1 family n=1 Tax=Alicyclobacillus vulcanalis TaxID=252246 RepID=A0A1N7PMW7_9BACL|nr:polysaccharide deacetylase family protein [Alicyclobacillus vulcanalis]SIT11906.1 Peptidoglycan/xylan/chitin deacetylase, PgdA/CDA1 family [Alicyclobacillus vulcanalis]